VSRTRYARSGDSRIAYELRGAWRRRRSWLVLIQGMEFDRHGWEPVLRNLGRHFRLVLVDNRGSGRSDLPLTWPATSSPCLTARASAEPT
jgi:pimeloyl-ACP methyl ester carboxylesterase